jgi:hypothetical protein
MTEDQQKAYKELKGALDENEYSEEKRIEARNRIAEEQEKQKSATKDFNEQKVQMFDNQILQKQKEIDDLKDKKREFLINSKTNLTSFLNGCDYLISLTTDVPLQLKILNSLKKEIVSAELKNLETQKSQPIDDDDD